MTTITLELAATIAAGKTSFDFKIIGADGTLTDLTSTVPLVEWTAPADGDYEASVQSLDGNGVHQLDPNMLAFSVSASKLNVAQGDGLLIATVVAA
jgi:hypothetical protein